mgnify:CR=1 FL=1
MFAAILITSVLSPLGLIAFDVVEEAMGHGSVFALCQTAALSLGTAALPFLFIACA